MFSGLTRKDVLLLAGFTVAALAMPLLAWPVGANYPDLLQKFAIYGIFAIGFNILFGLTGYLSFGHAAFLGVGSYAAVWVFKGLTMNVLPAVFFGVLVSGLFAALIGRPAPASTPNMRSSTRPSCNDNCNPVSPLVIGVRTE